MVSDNACWAEVHAQMQKLSKLEGSQEEESRESSGFLGVVWKGEARTWFCIIVRIQAVLDYCTHPIYGCWRQAVHRFSFFFYSHYFYVIIVTTVHRRAKTVYTKNKDLKFVICFPLVSVMSLNICCQYYL